MSRSGKIEQVVGPCPVDLAGPDTKLDLGIHKALRPVNKTWPAGKATLS